MIGIHKNPITFKGDFIKFNRSSCEGNINTALVNKNSLLLMSSGGDWNKEHPNTTIFSNGTEIGTLQNTKPEDAAKILGIETPSKTIDVTV